MNILNRSIPWLVLFLLAAPIACFVTPAEAAYSKAKYHGKALCPKGSFFDPRQGGQCWSCPGGAHRTVLYPVDSPKACEKRASSSWSKATYRGKAKNPKPKRAFYDPRKGGEWWRCPSSRPRRTAYPVTSSRACATKRIFGEKLSKAQYLGKVKRAKPQGAFYDPRKGGEYWSCPSHYHRTISPVTSAKACQRLHKAQLMAATFVKKFACDRGQFFDPRKGGECWSCPAKWQRTTRAVTSKQACTDRFGDIFVDSTAMCKTLISGMAKGAKAIDDLQKRVDKITAPLMSKAEAGMRAITSKMKTPSEVDKMAARLGKMAAPYQRQFNQLASMSAQLRRNKRKIRNTLLNPSLMCSGNSRQVIAALKAAGARPKRRSGLFDGWFVATAHAAAPKRTFYAFSVTNEGRTADKLFGATLGLTLVTDFRSHTRLFFSMGPYSSTKPGFSGSFDFMIFPVATIDDFDKIQQLGLAFGFSAGDTVRDWVKTWPKKLQTVVSALPGGLSISLDPGFNQIPGFGTTIISGSDEEGPGKIGLLDITVSMDVTFLLIKFQ